MVSWSKASNGMRHRSPPANGTLSASMRSNGTCAASTTSQTAPSSATGATQYPRRSSMPTASLPPVMRSSVLVITSMSLSKPPCAAGCSTFAPDASSATSMRSSSTMCLRSLRLVALAALRQVESAFYELGITKTRVDFAGAFTNEFVEK